MILQLGYKKQSNSRLENLLMIAPCFALIFTTVFTKFAQLDSHYSNTYFSFAFGNVIFFSWALLILPFILHLFLKQGTIGNPNIISAHILLSLLLLVSVLFTYDLYVPINMAGNNSFFGLPYQRHWLEATTTTAILLVAQFALQAIFIIYSLVKLLP